MHIVKLIPNENSKYHFGEGSLEESSYIFHSNSLFSTIVNNFVRLYGNNKFNKYKEEVKKLKISSLFPAIYKLNDKSEIVDKILFIPKPMVMLGFDKDAQNIIEEKPKDVKKIKFISIGALKKHNEGALKKITIGKEYLISDDEKKGFKYTEPKNMELFKKIIEQKVSIDRIKGTTLEYNEKGQLYSIEFIKPLRGKKKEGHRNIVGFYFLADFNNIDEKLINKIKASINLIKDEGIGGKRSTGAGSFKDIIIDEFKESLEVDELLNKEYVKKDRKYIPKKRWATLSITIPKDDNEFKCFDRYQLIKIGGYIYSISKIECITKLKKNVYTIAEGSICRDKINGDDLNLRPDSAEIDHEVILNGHPILIPIVSYEELNEEGDL